MKIGVLSDTHGHLQRTRAAVWLLKRQEIACVLHCGDIGSVEIVRELDQWPGHFVGGNVDQGLERDLAAAMSAQQTWHNQFADFILAGRRIAIAHGHDRKRLEATMFNEEFDLVCCGHTHQRQERRIGRTLVLNPGALYRTSTPGCAIVDLATMEVQMLDLSQQPT
jgi:uncharacterized protein